jgi:hypothetical protein
MAQIHFLTPYILGGRNVLSVGDPLRQHAEVAFVARCHESTRV